MLVRQLGAHVKRMEITLYLQDETSSNQIVEAIAEHLHLHIGQTLQTKPLEFLDLKSVAVFPIEDLLEPRR